MEDLPPPVADRDGAGKPHEGQIFIPAGVVYDDGELSEPEDIARDSMSKPSPYGVYLVFRDALKRDYDVSPATYEQLTVRFMASQARGSATWLYKVAATLEFDDTGSMTVRLSIEADASRGHVMTPLNKIAAAEFFDVLKDRVNP
jgi:hypothetical protein